MPSELETVLAELLRNTSLRVGDSSQEHSLGAVFGDGMCDGIAALLAPRIQEALEAAATSGMSHATVGARTLAGAMGVAAGLRALKEGNDG